LEVFYTDPQVLDDMPAWQVMHHTDRKSDSGNQPSSPSSVDLQQLDKYLFLNGQQLFDGPPPGWRAPRRARHPRAEFLRLALGQAPTVIRLYTEEELHHLFHLFAPAQFTHFGTSRDFR